MTKSYASHIAHNPTSRITVQAVKATAPGVSSRRRLIYHRMTWTALGVLHHSIRQLNMTSDCIYALHHGKAGIVIHRRYITSIFQATTRKI